MLQGVVTSARRLATAARVNNRTLLNATSSWTQSAALIHARLLSTAQPPPVLPETAAQRQSRLVKDAHSRIVNKMVAKRRFMNYDMGNVEGQTEDVVQYLERRLGMTREMAICTVALFPLLPNYTIGTMERKMAWFERNGVDGDMLKKAVRRHPMILGLSEETFEATKQWYLDHGIAPSKLPFMFSMSPRAMSFALDNLDSKVAYLKDVGLDDNKICRVLQAFPSVLGCSIENMTVKVDVARNLGLTDNEIVKMISLVPEFLALNRDEVKRKIRVLNDLFGEGTAVRLWVTSPRIIIRNSEQLRRSFQYLNEVVGLPRDRIAGNVALIMRNVDRVIRPRHEYLRKINAPDLRRVGWIKMSQSQFEERFPDCPAFLANEFKP